MRILLMYSSSATRICQPSPSSEPSSGRRAGSSSRESTSPDDSRVTSGTVKLNCVPRPGSLSNQIVPPINSTSPLEMDNPRPVPPNRRECELSAWVKDSNTRCW